MWNSFSNIWRAGTNGSRFWKNLRRPWCSRGIDCSGQFLNCVFWKIPEILQFLFWVGSVLLCSIILVLYSFVLYLTLVQNVTLFPILIWQKWTKWQTKVVIHANLVLTKETPKGIYWSYCCVFQPVNTCLRMHSHGRKQWKTLKNIKKVLFYRTHERLT